MAAERTGAGEADRQGTPDGTHDGVGSSSADVSGALHQPGLQLPDHGVGFGRAHGLPLDLGFEADDLESLLRYRMPFGRYSGRALIDLPEEYLLWFEREEFPTGELGRLMKLTLGIKRYGAEDVVKGLRGPRGNRNVDG